MKRDYSKCTPVIFRKWKGEPKSVIAFFPTIPDSIQAYGDIMSYEHIGQHGGADYPGLLAVTKLAKEGEYTDLLQELKSIGYDDLVVCKRYSRAMYSEFMRVWEKIENA